jgi:hypothetical protein
MLETWLLVGQFFVAIAEVAGLRDLRADVVVEIAVGEGLRQNCSAVSGSTQL